MHLGRSAPGTQNVIDGLLHFKKLRSNVKIIGFRGGNEGLLNNDSFEIKEEEFARFRNSGGFEFLGRTDEALRKPEELA